MVVAIITICQVFKRAKAQNDFQENNSIHITHSMYQNLVFWLPPMAKSSTNSCLTNCSSSKNCNVRRNCFAGRLSRGAMSSSRRYLSRSSTSIRQTTSSS
mmetsp:Transcript_1432/g.3054  ORF Transcript_1432/g.3054 Transcript_1432/m.3054 type:complete len:100 (+) Transcript_1432:1401-1700(+)